MVGEHDLDGLAEHHTAGILDGHAGGEHRAGPAEIRIEAGLVVENANSDDIIGDLRLRHGRARTDDKTNEKAGIDQS
jgi:hypothetical protein